MHAYINLTSTFPPALLPPVDVVLVFCKLSYVFRWKPLTRIVLPHNLEVVLPFYLFVSRYSAPSPTKSVRAFGLWGGEGENPI